MDTCGTCSEYDRYGRCSHYYLYTGFIFQSLIRNFDLTDKGTWFDFLQRSTLGEAPESNQGYVFKSRERYNAPSSSPDQNDTVIITGLEVVFYSWISTSFGENLYANRKFVTSIKLV